jgi:carbon-monoxide dehydrogenase medium subunit
VIPARFDYYRASTLDEALRLVSEVPGARIMAGGHSLIPAMKLRRTTPTALIDLAGLRGEFARVEERDGMLVIGALTRHYELETSDLVRRAAPSLAAAAAEIGDTQVRRCGTIGGSLAHADPRADLPAALAALEASVVVSSLGGDEVVPVVDLVRGAHDTSVPHTAVITSVRVPLRETLGFAYERFSRRAQDWVTVGVTVVRTEAGTRIGLANMAARPLRATAAEVALEGGASLAEAAALAAADTSPADDLAASAEFRSHLCRVLTERGLQRAHGARGRPQR